MGVAGKFPGTKIDKGWGGVAGMKFFIAGVAGAVEVADMNSRRNRFLTPALAMLCLFSLGAAQAKDVPPALEMARQLNDAFVHVAEEVSPAVVVIKVAQSSGRNFDEDNPLWDMLPPDLRKRLQEEHKQQFEENKRYHLLPEFNAEGSGVVIRQDGYILTNRHVVEDADKIRVRFKDGREYEAEVRGTDSQSDIAVIKIDAEGLEVARLGDSSQTRVGEFAIAIGAPFELDYSVTIGHVSAKGRSQVLPDNRMDQDFIQTDANINPGNSGGPLVNLYGEVIGINTLIRGLSTGIGFAIPSNLAREVADRLITDGKYVRSYLGVGIQSLREARDYRELVKGVEDGVVVTYLQPDGPAEKGGLKPSDVITAVNEQPVATVQELKARIRSKPIGDSLALAVHRGGKNLELTVVTVPWPERVVALGPSQNKAPEKFEPLKLGLKVEAVSASLTKRYGREFQDGVVVTGVETNSVAELKHLRKGDVITELNWHRVTSPSQFDEAIRDVDLKKGIVCNFIRDGQSQSIVLKDPIP